MLFAAGDEEAVLLRKDLVKHVGLRPWRKSKVSFFELRDIFQSFSHHFFSQN